MQTIPPQHVWLLESDHHGISPLRALLLIDRQTDNGLFPLLCAYFEADARFRSAVAARFPIAVESLKQFCCPPAWVFYGADGVPSNLRYLWHDLDVDATLEGVEHCGAEIISVLRRDLHRGTWGATALIGSDRKRAAVDSSLWQYIDQSTSDFRSWVFGMLHLAGVNYIGLRLWPSAGVPLDEATPYCGEWRCAHGLAAAEGRRDRREAIADQLQDGFYRTDHFDVAAGVRRWLPAARWAGPDRAAACAMRDVRLHLAAGSAAALETADPAGSNRQPAADTPSLAPIVPTQPAESFCQPRAPAPAHAPATSEKKSQNSGRGTKCYPLIVNQIHRQIWQRTLVPGGRPTQGDLSRIMPEVIREASAFWGFVLEADDIEIIMPGKSQLSAFIRKIFDPDCLMKNSAANRDARGFTRSEREKLWRELLRCHFEPGIIPKDIEDIGTFLETMMDWCVLHLGRRPTPASLHTLIVQAVYASPDEVFTAHQAAAACGRWEG